jgi:hypothetical protein
VTGGPSGTTRHVGGTTVSRTTTTPPAGKPDQDNDEDKQYAWHRHPALIAAIPAVFTLIGGVLAIVLGQADKLPAAINPAPPPTTVSTTQTVTATAISTVTETVTATPTTTEPTVPTGSGTVPASNPPAPGALAITIRIGTGGKIGPNEWRAGSTPGATADVFDDTGRQLNRGCYPTWTLKRGSTRIQTVRGTACEGNGFSMFSFQFDALKTPGTYHLTVSVVTDGGAKGTATQDFTVT